MPVGIWGVENFSAGQEFNPITAGQSVPDKLNDTLLDPDLTWALCILHYQTASPLQLITSAHREESATDTSRERKKSSRLASPSLSLPGNCQIFQRLVSHGAISQNTQDVPGPEGFLHKDIRNTRRDSCPPLPRPSLPAKMKRRGRVDQGRAARLTLSV